MKNNFCPITIDASIAEVQGSEEYGNAIMNLGQINCFVGSNNSGKSRIIRNIFAKFSNDMYLSKKQKESVNNIINDKDKLWLIRCFLSGKIHNENWEQLKSIFNSIDSRSSSLNDWPNIRYKLKNLIPILPTVLNNKTQILGTFSDKNPTFNTEPRFKALVQKGFKYQTTEKTIEEEINKELKLIADELHFLEKNILLPKLYIPILRGMRKLGDSDKDFYTERTYKDYKIGNPDKNETFTGLSIYNDLYNHLLGEANKRKLVKNFEDFLSKNFFDNQEVSLIPMLDKDVVYIKIGDKELPIYELGDGVQALIILTFPLFLRKEEPHAVFIEEPELHLHPKWQRFFLKTIKEEFPNHYFFFTTHSNVFLNSKGVSIYHVTQSQEKNKSLIRYVDGHAIEALEDLGYHASDLFNTNYILWVEGISDKIYLKKFIEVFDNTLEEGIDYTIMLYGGCAQLKHFLLEAESSDAKISIPFLNKNFGFCVDSDKTQKGDVLKTEKTDIKKSCEEQDKFCWITDVRETENLIPKEIWVKAAIDYAKTIRQYEMATESDCEIPEGDWNFVDLLKTKVKRPNSSNGETLKINDKIKMAKAVTKIFPQNKENLKLTLELYDNIKQLVEKIKSVKPESNL